MAAGPGGPNQRVRRVSAADGQRTIDVIACAPAFLLARVAYLMHRHHVGAIALLTVRMLKSGNGGPARSRVPVESLAVQPYSSHPATSHCCPGMTRRTYEAETECGDPVTFSADVV